jgi:hypothetical protein
VSLLVHGVSLFRCYMVVCFSVWLMYDNNDINMNEYHKQLIIRSEAWKNNILKV